MQDSFQQRVRLFKKIILFGTVAIVAVLLMACVILAVNCAGLANRSKQYESDIKILQSQIDNLTEQNVISRNEVAKLEEKLAEKRKKEDPTFDYQTKYPDLYVERGERIEPAEKTVYLTFDDGPSGNTKGLLNILDKYNVKATFFVVGYQIKGREDVLKDIVARGHTIGIHTDSHNYNKIYNSVDSYLDDFYSISKKSKKLQVKSLKFFAFRAEA